MTPSLTFSGDETHQVANSGKKYILAYNFTITFTECIICKIMAISLARKWGFWPGYSEALFKLVECNQ